LGGIFLAPTHGQADHFRNPPRYYDNQPYVVCLAGKPFYLRACLISQRVWIGERIFCPARQKSAGILTDGKDF
jgi:hypothetical protein